jgi:prevent-host-death family protein
MTIYMVQFKIMIQVNIAEAKTHLSRYLRKAKQGETVILCERNVPVAELRPLQPAKRTRKRVFGLSKGIRVGPEFFKADKEIEKWANAGPIFPR